MDADTKKKTKTLQALVFAPLPICKDRSGLRVGRTSTNTGFLSLRARLHKEGRIPLPSNPPVYKSSHFPGPLWTAVSLHLLPAWHSFQLV